MIVHKVLTLTFHLAKLQFHCLVHIRTVLDSHSAEQAIRKLVHSSTVSELVLLYYGVLLIDVLWKGLLT